VGVGLINIFEYVAESSMSDCNVLNSIIVDPLDNSPFTTKLVPSTN
jgi:hypothetical protein